MVIRAVTGAVFALGGWLMTLVDSGTVAHAPASPTTVVVVTRAHMRVITQAAEARVTTTTAAPAPDERRRRCPALEDTLREYGLEPVDTFSFIAWRETRCDPSLVNATFDSAGRVIKALNRDGSYDVGLLQVNSTWKTVTASVCGTPWGDMFALLDLDCNLRVARYLLDNGGLVHWGL